MSGIVGTANNGGSAAAPTGAQPAILASAATGIVSHIERLHGDIDSIFGNAGIAPEMAGLPTLQLRLAAFITLFEEAARRTQQDNFGLWFGNQFMPRDLGLWGYAAVSAPTLGSALETLVNLFPYQQGSSFLRCVRRKDGLLRLEYQIIAPDIVARRQDAELSLGMFLNVIREAMGPRWAPEEVHFEHPRPQAWKDHEDAFDAPVYFSQPTNALLFRTDILGHSMPARDLQLLAVMYTCMEQLGPSSPAADGLYDRIYAAIRMRLPNGYPTLDQIAHDLRISPGAVQRELSDRNITYKDAVETTRRNLAEMYLQQRQLPLTEIALLLGYSELSAFSRAFTRWTGTSPRHYRRMKTGH
jgi:AraC-like DNA-binding protein